MKQLRNAWNQKLRPARLADPRIQVLRPAVDVSRPGQFSEGNTHLRKRSGKTLALGETVLKDGGEFGG